MDFNNLNVDYQNPLLGMLKPSGFGQTAPAPAPTPVDPSQGFYDKSDQMRQQALGVQQPSMPHPTLLMLLGMMLADATDPRGKPGMAAMQGFNSSAQGLYQDHAQHAQQQQQQLMGRADILQNQGARAHERFQGAETAAFRDRQLQQDQTQFEQGDATKRLGLGLTLEGKKYTADAGLTRAQIIAKARKDASELAKAGKDAAIGLSLVLHGSPTDKANGYGALRANIPALSALRDDEIDAAAEALTPEQQAQIAQAAASKATAALTGEKTKGVTLDNTFKSRTLNARVQAAQKQVDAIAAKTTLTQDQANLIAKQVAHYDAEFQGRAAERKARIAKLDREEAAGGDPLKVQQQQRLAYEQAGKINEAQIKALLSRYKDALPSEESDPNGREFDDALRLKALQHEQEGLKKRMAKLAVQPASLSGTLPLPQGTPEEYAALREQLRRPIPRQGVNGYPGKKINGVTKSGSKYKFLP